MEKLPNDYCRCCGADLSKQEQDDVCDNCEWIQSIVTPEERGEQAFENWYQESEVVDLPVYNY